MFKLRRKLIPLLLALFIFNSTYAQSEKIDLSIKNESLRQLIKQIETKTDYSFMLDQTVDQSQKVSVEARQESLDAILPLVKKYGAAVVGLTLDCNGVLLVTGLCNMQTIRTAEMADVSCILFVRGKKATPEMLQLAAENDMILMETDHSMYHTVGELYCNGLPPIY